MKKKDILKRIKHQKYKDKQLADQILQEKDPLLWQQTKVLRASEKGSFWQIPVTDRAYLDSGKYQKDYKGCSEGLNGVRASMIGATLSWYKNDTIAKRNNLKKYYDEKHPVYWEATLANVACRNKHNVNLLLDRPVVIDPNKPLQVAFRISQVEMLDYHMWLSINKIVSLPNTRQEFAQGDAIRGVSFISKYKSKGQTKYGLDKTVLFDIGVAIEERHTMNQMGWQSVNGQIISDYDRFDEKLLMLANDNLVPATKENAVKLLSNKRPSFDVEVNLDNQLDYSNRYEDKKYHELHWE